MKLNNITISNYRQFEKAELSFHSGITVLAGANNSGKTSLISLIKNVFGEDKSEYSESDIPAKNMQEWIDTIYPFFWDFFQSEKETEKVDDELVEKIIPKDENLPREIIRTTDVKVHVDYAPDNY